MHNTLRAPCITLPPSPAPRLLWVAVHSSLWELGSGLTQSSGPRGWSAPQPSPLGLSGGHGSVSSPRPGIPPRPAPCLCSSWRGPSISNPDVCWSCSSLLTCPARPRQQLFLRPTPGAGLSTLVSGHLQLSPALSCSSRCGPGAVAPWELVRKAGSQAPSQTDWMQISF